MSDLSNEKYILQIRRSGSISKAAAALGISQPALSMKLNQMEKSFGFTVFDRKTAPVALTAAGAVYMEYLDRKHVLDADYRKRIDEIVAEQSERISVGAPTVYVDSVLIDAVSELHGFGRGYRICIKTAPVPELLEMTANSELDCFITTTPVKDKDFECVPIRSERTYLCFAGDSELAAALPDGPVSEEDLPALNGRNMIFLNPDLPMQIALDEVINRYKLSVSSYITVDQTSTALSLVRKNAGICLATSETIHPDANTGLCTRSMHQIIPDRMIYVAYHKAHYISNACTDLINILKRKEKEK
ncbi:MAG: LysR family transcriptional regulator [Lachnospiraceae bacterium]|nr:LysR family transcriptional regulator [Lachnospiraceae bacterium]